MAASDDTNRRRQEILAVAAKLFAQHGYNGVGVRQIADAAGILGGSLYHHFESKQALYIEVHKSALSQAAEAIETAIGELVDPWDRLYAATKVHLAFQLAPDSLTMPMMSDHAAMNSEMRRELVKHRDRFESIYRGLIVDLPLPGSIDRDVYRLCLLSLINSIPRWFRPGRMSLDELVSQMMQVYRSPARAALAAPKPRSLARTKIRADR
jgi:AcrR family transcriptional regulator